MLGTQKKKNTCRFFEMTASESVLVQDEEGSAWGLINLRRGYREGHKACQQLEPEPSSRAKKKKNKAKLPISPIQMFYIKKCTHF